MELEKLFALVYFGVAVVFALAALIYLIVAQNKSSKEYNKSIDSFYENYKRTILGDNYDKYKR